MAFAGVVRRASWTRQNLIGKLDQRGLPLGEGVEQTGFRHESSSRSDFGHTSTKVTEKSYSPWVAARQARLEEAVRKTWPTEPPALRLVR